MINEIPLSELEKSMITFSIPKENHDGTLSITIRDGNLVVTINTNFVEEYEKRLYSL